MAVATGGFAAWSTVALQHLNGFIYTHLPCEKAHPSQMVITKYLLVHGPLKITDISFGNHSDTKQHSHEQQTIGHVLDAVNVLFTKHKMYNIQISKQQIKLK